MAFKGGHYIFCRQRADVIGVNHKNKSGLHSDISFLDRLLFSGCGPCCCLLYEYIVRRLRFDFTFCRVGLAIVPRVVLITNQPFMACSSVIQWAHLPVRMDCLRMN